MLYAYLCVYIYICVCVIYIHKYIYVIYIYMCVCYIYICYIYMCVWYIYITYISLLVILFLSLSLLLLLSVKLMKHRYPPFLQPALIETQRVQATAQPGAAPALAMMEDFAAILPNRNGRFMWYDRYDIYDIWIDGYGWYIMIYVSCAVCLWLLSWLKYDEIWWNMWVYCWISGRYI